MATPTQTPPDQDEFNPQNDVGKENFDKIVSQFDAKERARMERGAQEGHVQDLNSAHNAPDGQGSSKGLRDIEAGASQRQTSDEDLGTQESRGDANWKNDVKEMGPVKARADLFTSAVKLRGVGALLAVLGVMFATLGLLISLITGALGLINLKELALSKMSLPFSNALDNRAVKVMTKKMAGDLTSGSCSVVKVKCRYRGMSSREINRYNKRALGKGLPVRIITDDSRRSLNPLKKPVKLVVFNQADLPSGAKPDDVPNRNVRTIPADQVRSTLRTNPLVRQATRDFYKSKVEFYSGKAAQSVWTRTKTFLGKRKIGPGEGDTEKERQEYRQRKNVREATSGQAGDLSARTFGSTGSEGETEAEKASREEADRKINNINGAAKDAVQAEVDTLGSERNDYSKNLSSPEPGTEAYSRRYDASTDKIANAGGGALNTVGLGNALNFIQNVCLVRVLVAAVDDSRAILQAIQFMQFAAMVATLPDITKSGDADADTSQQINDTMTLFNSVDAEGFTAFDSMGYNWISNGSVRTSGGEDVGTYQNGGTPPGILGSVVGSVVNSGFLKTTCGLALSPAGVAIGIGITVGSVVAGLFTGGTATAGAIGAREAAKRSVEFIAENGIKNFIKKSVVENASKKYLTKQLAKDVGGTATKLGAMEAFFRFGVPPLINTTARALTRTVVTGDEKGRAVGNAFVSGFGVITSQMGKAQGLQPLSVASAGRVSAIAYNDRLKIAKEEGIDQFDISNEFSFASKFTAALAPNSTKISSISSLPSIISSIPSVALNNLAGTAQAATDPEAQFKYCKDDKLKDAGVAGDPFCNPQYGMDPVALNSEEFDPDAVVDYLYENKLIDDDGKPIDDFEDFIQNCMQTDAPLGNTDDCKEKIDSSSTASVGNKSLADSLIPSANAATSVSISEKTKKITMMRMYCIDTSIDADMNDGKDTTSCAPEQSGSASTDDASESTDSGGEVSGDAKQLAQELLDSSNVSFPLDSASPNGSTKSVLEKVAGGEKAPVTCPSGPGGSVTIKEEVLKFLVELSKETRIGINAITDKCHSSGSNHYKGTAVDFECKGVPFDVALGDKIAAKYNGKRNGETCDGDSHWHYDF